jgi:hypothetical protein
VREEAHSLVPRVAVLRIACLLKAASPQKAAVKAAGWHLRLGPATD